MHRVSAVLSITPTPQVQRLDVGQPVERLASGFIFGSLS